MAADPRVDIPKLLTRDWTLMNAGETLFQQATYEFPTQGRTTKKEKHFHLFEVDENGNGWALDAHDPQEPRIHHRHEVRNWVVHEAQSNCWPDCDQLNPPPHGDPPATGVPLHGHRLMPRTKVLDNRYSIVVVTDATTTDGNETTLQQIKDNAIRPGFENLLEFYNKIDRDASEESAVDTATAEDWYLSPRPKSKIKVLVSIPMEILDNLRPTPPPAVKPSASEEIYLNTSTLEKKIKGVGILLKKMNSEIEEFLGKTPGIDLPYQAELLSQFVPQVAQLVQDNNFTFDRGRSDLLALGIDDEYKFVYAEWNPGICFTDLNVGFNNFVKSRPAANDRTVYLLLKLDELYDIHKKNEQYTWSDFLGSFILNSPDIDFSEAARRSSNCDESGVKESIKAANTRNPLTQKQIEEEKEALQRRKARQDLKRTLDGAAEFVGDSMVGQLDSIVSDLTTLTGYATRNPSNYLSDGIWKDLLNKIPIQNLIASAMECIGFKGFEYINLSKQFLNQASAALEDTANLIGSIPSMSSFWPEDFPTANYMKAVGKQMLEALINAVINVLVETIVGIIEQLLNLCNECALQNEAAGKGRLDGLNFGGVDLGAEFGKALAGGTIGTLTQTLARGTRLEQEAAQIAAESEAHAKNPLWVADYPGFTDALGHSSTGEHDVDFLPHQEVRKRIQQETEANKQEYAAFIRASSEVLTPGEMGNMLLGCGVGNNPLNAVDGLLKSGAFPRINAIAGEDSAGPHKFITKTFKELGKLVGNRPVLQKVKDVTEAIPIELRCFSEVNETALRKAMLEEKGLSLEQAEEQAKKSKARTEKALKELSVMLEKDNLLEGIAPDIYCKMVFRTEDGTIVPNEKVMRSHIPGSLGQDQFVVKHTGELVFKGVKQGIMDKNPPVFIHMMDQVLDTLYDGCLMSWNQDINNFIPALIQSTTVEREVKRTLDANIDGQPDIILNPQWISLVKDPNLNYEFGALPAEALVPGKSWRLGQDEETGILGLGSDAGDVREGLDDIGWARNDPALTENERAAMTAGERVQFGQPMPTGEQERIWEQLMKHGPAAATTGGGRRRPTEYYSVPDDVFRFGRISGGYRKNHFAKYTQIYGYSPIPVMIKERGPEIVAPGLREAFQKMCFSREFFDVNDVAQRLHVYSLQVPNNLFEGVGMDYDSMVAALNTAPSDVGGASIGAGGAGISSTKFAAGASSVVQALSFIKNSQVDINYQVPFTVPHKNGIPQDSFDVTITMRSDGGGHSAKMPSLNLYQASEIKDLTVTSPRIVPVIENISTPTASSDPNIPQEKLFTAWNQDIWDGGGAIYQNGEKVSPPLISPTEPGPNNKSYTQGIGLTTAQQNSLKDFYLSKTYGPSGAQSSSYDCLWKDFYCALTNNISESPFLDLKKIGSLNLTPMNKIGQTCDLNASLLDVELIKQRVKEEYGLIQCIESCIPNVSGEGTNKDNPFEKANLGGAVLLTIRTYVLEILMRSIFSFYYFRYKAPEDVDSVLISYIEQSMRKDIADKNFFGEFARETIELYNRNAGNMTPPKQQLKTELSGGFYPEGTDLVGIALEYFIRLQIFGVSNRLTKTLGTTGDTALDSILLEEWLPSYAVPSEIGPKARILGYTKADPPDPAGRKLDPDRVLQLLGNGTLSQGQIKKFNTAGGPVGTGKDAYIFKYPIGFLFRKYFAHKKHPWRPSPVLSGSGTNFNDKIWSMNSPVARGSDWAEKYKPETAPWLGGEERRSKSKQIGYVLGGANDGGAYDYAISANVREWWTLWESGLLMHGPMEPARTPAQPPGVAPALAAGNDDFSKAGLAALDPKPAMVEDPNDPNNLIPATPPGRPHIPGEDEVTPYEFGVSFGEQEGMAEIIKMVAASLVDNTRQAASFVPSGSKYIKSTDNRNTLNSYTINASFQGWGNLTIYPGFFLKYYNEPWRSPASALRATNAATLRKAKRSVERLFYAAKGGGTTLPEIFAVLRETKLPNNKGLMLAIVNEWAANALLPEDENKFRIQNWTTDWPTLDAMFIDESDDPTHELNAWRILVTEGLANAAPTQVDGFEAATDPHYWGIENTLGSVGSGDSPGHGRPLTAQYQLLKRGVDLWHSGMPYLSLLDFDLGSIKSLLVWEQNRVRQTWNEDGSPKHTGWTAPWNAPLSAANYRGIIAKYDDWIASINGIYYRLAKADEGRTVIAADLKASLADPQASVSRRPMKHTAGEGFENGNFIVEYYVRAEELPYQGMSCEQFKANYQDRLTPQQRQHPDLYEGIEYAKWLNSNFIDVRRNEFLKGVMNFDTFNDYLKTRFNFHGNPVIRSGLGQLGIDNAACSPVKLRKALLIDTPLFADCGEQQATELGIRLEESDDWFLSDFFKKVSMGIRISYVVAPETFVSAPVHLENMTTLPPPATGGGGGIGGQPFSGEARTNIQCDSTFASNPCHRDHSADPMWDALSQITWHNDGSATGEGAWQAPNAPFKSIWDDHNWENAAMKEKAFFVKEVCVSGSQGTQNPDEQCDINSSRYIHVVPIISVEQEIPGNTPMKDVCKQLGYSRVAPNAQGIPTTYFDSFFKKEYFNRLDGPDGLRAQMKETEEFKALFKYMFPIDRMLSLTTLYSSTFLSSYKNLNGLFDATKIDLKRLFFICLKSGNYKADECGPNNLDLQLSVLNGMDIEGLGKQLAMMALKAAFIIYKNYVEVSDPNIGTSKKIVSAIKIVNKLIAQGQMAANQAQQLAASIAQMADDLGNLGDPCKTNLPGTPPADWFEPIEENFIPEPQIFFISLALLPITLLPLFWPGIPLNIPGSIPYWFLDAKPYDIIPGPNWFQDLQWPSKLISGGEEGGEEIPTGAGSCEINIGVPDLGPKETNGGE